jgi:hypothetical protein
MADDARYRLAPVREVRERTEASRRGDLANAVGDARETEAALAVARARTERAELALAAALALLREPFATTERRVIAERFVTRKRRELDDARDAELRAATAHDARLGNVDNARAHLAHARAARELIERHFARWRDARAKLAERRGDD